MSRRIPLLAALAVAVLVPFARHAAPARAQVPNRIFGTVTLNGQPAAVGTTIEALTAGKSCGTTTVRQTTVSGTSYPYQMDLPSTNEPACKPGAVVTFTVGGATAGQTFTLTDVGDFARLDLTAPGTPNVPTTASNTVSLRAGGCTDVTSTFPNGTTPQTIAAAIAPASALNAIWRVDRATGMHRGFSPLAPFASDLQTVDRGDTLRICTTAAATLTQTS